MEGEGSVVGLCGPCVFNTDITEDSAVVIGFFAAKAPTVGGVVLAGRSRGGATILWGVAVEQEAAPIACAGGWRSG